MIKGIVYLTKIILIITLLITATSCKYNLNDSIQGNGTVTTEKRSINEAFSKIDVNRGIEVIINQNGATTQNIEVETDENLIKLITTKVVDGTLFISTSQNISTTNNLIVRIKMPTIIALNSTSGSSISNTNSIKGNSIAIKSSSGSNIDLALEYDAIISECTSGSEINLKGKALKLNTKSSSGSTTNAQKLLVNDVVAEATSGSSININPIVTLVAKASSGASIDYAKTVKKITKEETSGGSIDETEQ